MGVGSGSGNSISFSTIRDFYGDTNPVSLSEFNRSSNNSGLVDSTFAGVSTATSTSGNATKNDFGVTTSTGTVFTGTLRGIISRVSTNVSNNSGGNTISDTYTVLASDSVLILGGGGSQHQGGDDPPDSVGTWSTSGIINISPVASGQAKFYRGPAYQSGDSSDLTFSGDISAGTFTITSSVGSAGGGVSVSTRRRDAVTTHDVTFTNNNSTGDTYTLASSSTRLDSTDASQLVYAAGTTRQVKDDSTSGQWTIAYDNVSGSGSGTAGDIGVTVTNQTDTRTTSTGFVSGQSTICTLDVPNLSGLSFVSATGSAQEPNNDGSSGVTLKLNGTTVASDSFPESSGSSVTYTGSASANDTFQVLGGQSGRSISITFTTPSRSIVFQNNGSSSITLGGSTTPGGARTIAASASSTAQSAGSAGGFTNNQDWQIFFDTGSGDCNVGIPTTIGVGNPVNMDLFNTVTTPVG